MQKIFSKLVLGAFVLALSACGIFQSEPIDETRNWSPAKLYAEARDELGTGNYEKAIQYFEKLESRYPFGVYAQQAQMQTAYAYYRQGEQAQALAATERFIKLHPNHPNLDYIYYLRGLINFNDRVGFLSFFSNQDLSERDPKAAQDAFNSFKQLVDRFPDSKYAPDARARMNYLVNALAQHEIHVANYYFRRGAYLAAANRAQNVVKEFRDAPAVEEALHLMVRSYDALGLPQLRDDAARVLKLNFPNSDFIDAGRKKDKRWWQFW